MYLHEIFIEGDALARHGIDEPAVHRKPQLK